MLATGILQLSKSKSRRVRIAARSRRHYNIWVILSIFSTILGIWKILGVVALLIPKYPLLKEWAYAGFFFIMSGAIVSHIASDDPAKELFPRFYYCS